MIRIHTRKHDDGFIHLRLGGRGRLMSQVALPPDPEVAGLLADEPAPQVLEGRG